MYCTIYSCICIGIYVKLCGLIIPSSYRYIACGLLTNLYPLISCFLFYFFCKEVCINYFYHFYYVSHFQISKLFTCSGICYTLYTCTCMHVYMCKLKIWCWVTFYFLTVTKIPKFILKLTCILNNVCKYFSMLNPSVSLSKFKKEDFIIHRKSK